MWWLSKAANALSWLGPIATSLITLALFVTNIFTMLVFGALDAAATAIQTLDLSRFGNAQFAIIQGIGYVNAIFPLAEILIVLAAYYTAWISVISIRWVKSFIPTIAN